MSDRLSEAKKKMTQQLDGEIPSQVPMNVVKETYERMMQHATTEGGRWACRKNGAKIHAKVWFRSVWSTKTLQFMEKVPVAHLYCSGCEKEPSTRGGNSTIFDSELMTCTM